MLFDTHAHYDDEAFDPDRDAVLSALPEQGVALVLNPGCDLHDGPHTRRPVRRPGQCRPGPFCSH